MTKIIAVPSGGACELDVEGSGFAHGFGIFETILFENGKLYFWQRHWDRFERSARALNLDLNVKSGVVLDQVRNVCREFDCSGRRAIKLSLIQEKEGSVLFVYSRPAMDIPTGVSVCLSELSPLNEHSILAGHKTHNYLENLLLLQNCRISGYFESIRINTTGYVSEAAAANLFFVAGKKLHTPSLETGALPGVVREVIVEKALRAGIDVLEGCFTPDALEHADALILTNSTVGLLPVSKYNGSPVRGTAGSGALVASLMEYYQRAFDTEAVAIEEENSDES